MNAAAPIRVMLVDDSAIIRGLMQRALNADPEVAIVATAVDGAQAIETLKKTPADVLILDIEMPVMDGLTALPHLLKVSPGLKIIMASTLTLRNAEISMRAMALGAIDYLPKPSAANPGEVQDFYRLLLEKIKALATSRARPTDTAIPASASPVVANVRVPAGSPTPPATSAPRPGAATAGLSVAPASTVAEAMNNVPRAGAIAIASSTGGPQALLSVFSALKGRKFPVPVFITQHMPPNFTTILADHISKNLGGDCHEAKTGEEVKPGIVYLAPGDFHMTVERAGTGIRLKLDQNPPENFCRPSADPMLRSLASVYGNKLVTIVLTGMGSDGAPGSAEVVRQGGTVVAQNEASCVVYGMPRAVVDAKLAKAILPLDQMAPYMAKAMGV